MTLNPHILPTTGKKSARLVVMAALPKVQFLDMAGPMEAFQIANSVRAHNGKPPAYRMLVASPGERLKTAAGLEIVTTPLAALDVIPHTIFVGGHLRMAETPETPETLSLLRPLVDAATRVVSVCSGAFVLGDLGLLDGRRCTTHWLVLDALRRRFPAAEVESDALYVDQNPVYTSAGCTAGIDLALFLIARDLGPRMALAVARLMVMFLHRPGGQSQFSAGLAVCSQQDERLGLLMAEIAATPGGDHTVQNLACRVGMSPRNFARTFKAATGKPPATYVRDVRVSAARQALETSDVPPSHIALACGLGSEETLRRLFQKDLGTTPAAYRRRFRRTPRITTG